MATQNAPFSQGQLDSLDKEKAKLEASLRQSTTAYASNTPPSSQDLSMQARLQQIGTQRQALINKRLAENWYGNETGNENETTAKKPLGLIGGAIDMLSKPLYGIVGAAETALGKGTKKGLLANIDDNTMVRKETFGNLLQKVGLNHAAAAPLGFALDIAFDPVNWATAGTAAMIPRVGYGLVKGGAEGAAKGLASSVLEKTATAGKYVPYFRKSERLKQIGESAITNWEDYNKVVGRDFMKILDERAERITLGDVASNIILRLPGGENILKQVEYNPATAQRVMHELDEMNNAQRKAGTVVEQTVTYEGEVIGPQAAETKMAMQNAGKMKQPVPTTPLDYEKENTRNIVNEGLQIAEEKPNLLTTHDGDASASFMQGEAINDRLFKESAEKTAQGAMNVNQAVNTDETGVKWYDDFIKKIEETWKIKDVKVGKKVLDTLRIFDNTFKSMKIGLNPGSYTNALMGNIAMYGMYGGSIHDTKWMKSVFGSFRNVTGHNTDQFLQEILFNPLWGDYIRDYAGTFEKTYGIKTEQIFIKNKLSELMSNEELLSEMKKNGLGVDQTKEKMLKMIGELRKQAMDTASKSGSKSWTTGAELADKAEKAQDIGTSIGANELRSKAYNEFKDLLKAKAASGDIGAKAFLWSLDKPMKAYEKFDQSFKLGSSMHMTLNGLTEGELQKMSKMTKISSADIVEKFKDGGEFRYRINPKKATEIVNEIYLNYNAMPGAVKVLRAMPIIGSPFFSFTYGMTHNTAKALAYNPSFFNKITFAMNEIGGQKSPLEKKGLDSKYYSWFTQLGMMKIPFFQENPVYLNVANMLPYLTLNMFTPSERKYEKTLPAEIVSMIDRTPLLKHPIGQVIFDYFLQPMIIKDSNPQGSFGQVLYPKDATAIDKAGYATRSLVESITPGVAGYLGPFIPQSILDYFPSYYGRKIGYSVHGKNPIGYETKTPASERFLESMSASVGLPVYPMDLENLTKQVNNNK